MVTGSSMHPSKNARESEMTAPMRLIQSMLTRWISSVTEELIANKAAQHNDGDGQKNGGQQIDSVYFFDRLGTHLSFLLS